MIEKDYKEIAEIINEGIHTQGIPPTEREIVIMNKLADYFERDNKDLMLGELKPFNRQQFLKECGVK
ncbi:unnamed protein product [marine sediment metagenome]|uniref:Uncharacterized protein n=1 Tax=marine sediment metagenome TaxID=412755 RepID=X0XZ10_9ZZZZ